MPDARERSVFNFLSTMLTYAPHSCTQGRLGFTLLLLLAATAAPVKALRQGTEGLASELDIAAIDGRDTADTAAEVAEQTDLNAADAAALAASGQSQGDANAFAAEANSTSATEPGETKLAVATSTSQGRRHARRARRQAQPAVAPAATCTWTGHCAGDPCRTANDCDGELVCVNGKCGSSSGR